MSQIYKGNTYEFTFNVVSNDQQKDLSGAVNMIYTISDGIGDTNFLVLDSNTNPDQVYIDSINNSLVVIKLSSDNTKELPNKVLYHELHIIDFDLTESTIFQDKIVVLATNYAKIE